MGINYQKKAKILLYSIDLTVSAITKIEVLGWINASKKQLQPLYDFMEIAHILPINDAVIEKTITIRQAKKIALGDAIIAATALVYDLVIISRNVSDFKNIEGLQVIDPYNTLQNHKNHPNTVVFAYRSDQTHCAT